MKTLNKKLMIVAGVLAVGMLSTRAQEPPAPAGAAPQQGKGGRGGGGGRGPQVDAPPAADLTGSWVLASEVAKPTVTLILKQTGNSLTGEYKLTTPFAGLPPIILMGAIGGSQVDVMSLFDYQGGEALHIRAEYKDGHIVGQRSSIHSSPRKWRQDGNFEVDYVRAESK